MLLQIDYCNVQIYQSLGKIPSEQFNHMLLPHDSHEPFKRVWFFLSAELGMEALVVAHMPPWPHAQGPASFGTPAAIPTSDPVCPEKPHTSLVHVALIHRIPSVPTPPRLQKTNPIGHTTPSFQTHPFLAPFFEGPCKQKLQ